MSDLAHLLRYLEDPHPEEHDHRHIEEILADPARRTELLHRLAQQPRSRFTEMWGARWENWLGGDEVQLSSLEDDLPDFDALCHAVRACEEPLRATGQRHADGSIGAPVPGSVVIDLRNWQRGPGQEPTPAEVRRAGESIQVRVFGFERLGEVIRRLDAEGLALVNTGSFTGQTIAGPFSVGTHGSGAALGAMPDGVVAVDLLGADGQVRRVRAPRCAFPAEEVVELPRGRGRYRAVPPAEPVPLEAAVVNLGTFGVVMAYILEVVPIYRLAQQVRIGKRTAMLEEARRRLGSRHVELLIRPDKPRNGEDTVLIVRDLAPDGRPDRLPPPLPEVVDIFRGDAMGRVLGALVSRSKPVRKHLFDGIFDTQARMDDTCGPWDRILVRDTGIAAHGFEVFIPLAFFETGIEVILGAVWAAFDQDRAPSTAPIGVRFVRSGPHWLAMSHEEYFIGGRVQRTDVWVTVELPRLLGARNQERIPHRVLEALREHRIPHRPHWGQYFPLEQVRAQNLYPRLPDWRRAWRSFGADRRLLTPALADQLGVGRVIPRLQARRRAESEPGRRVLLVHGCGEGRRGLRDAIRVSFEAHDQPEPVIRTLRIDDLFEPDIPDAAVKAVLTEAFGDVLRYRSSRGRGRAWLAEIERSSAWSPAHLVQWLQHSDLRSELRDRLHALLVRYRPDLIVAHGLGGLIVYDALSWCEEQRAHGALDLITQGAPVGHPAFLPLWGGRVERPKAVERWFDIYNPMDPLFSVPSVLPPEVERVRIQTPVGVDPHHAAVYLREPRVQTEVWRPVLQGDRVTVARFARAVRSAGRSPRKALLVGVNRYALGGTDLEGCVNDVFAISELLQRRYGYARGEIRLLTDERATLEAFQERLTWLLEDARPGDRRVLFFSGHGTRIPSYNAMEEVDRVDECLALHDFDWRDPETAFVDDTFAAFYSQLPFGVQFVALFDCCHAGGMSRAPGARVRGLVPPDDIRHRMLRFEKGRWKERSPSGPRRVQRDAPSDGGPALGFLGSAVALRPPRSRYDRAREVRGHGGPFMPTLAFACAEGELAFEHQAGATVHGAFTWCLVRALQRRSASSARQLIDGRVRRAVAKLGYRQRPEVSGPSVRLEAPFEL